jgi:predicted small lipoprotein YifL
MKLHLVPEYCCAVAILLGAAGLLSACGQYGDLYLPEKQPPSQPADKPQDKDPQQTED